MKMTDIKTPPFTPTQSFSVDMCRRGGGGGGVTDDVLRLWPGSNWIVYKLRVEDTVYHLSRRFSIPAAVCGGRLWDTCKRREEGKFGIPECFRSQPALQVRERGCFLKPKYASNARARAHARTHTHTLPACLSLSVSLCLSVSVSVSLSLSLSHTHTHTHTHTYTHTHTHTHTHNICARSHPHPRVRQQNFAVKKKQKKKKKKKSAVFKKKVYLQEFVESFMVVF